MGLFELADLGYKERAAYAWSYIVWEDVVWYRIRFRELVWDDVRGLTTQY